MNIPIDRRKPRIIPLMEVHKRGGFSDRNNIKKENEEIQLYDFDERTRIAIYNKIVELHNSVFPIENSTQEWDFINQIMASVYIQVIDHDNYFTRSRYFNIIKDTIINDYYYSVLTLIEEIVRGLEKNNRNAYLKGSSLYVLINSVFEQEYVGYRFIGGMIAPISDNREIEGIEEALYSSYHQVNVHIEKASKYLSDREKPDYENSIKESISAVEAMCEIITGAKGNDATLGKMLKKLEDSDVDIHKSLKTAFNQLYSYTNDANGIRHAGDIGGPDSTFEEAKFMLVACSAFINYLKGIQAGIN